MRTLLASVVLLGVACLGLAGCNSKADSEKQSGPASGTPAVQGATDSEKTGEHGHSHAGDAGHPTEGPHHGSLVELGDEEYHAEVLHDEEAGKVTIYLLDGSAKNAVAIPDKALTVNLMVKGKPSQAMLPAKPDDKDPAGQSSRFELVNASFAEQLDREDANATLVVKIKGATYRGKLEHEHGHEGHDHTDKEGEGHTHDHN